MERARNRRRPAWAAMGLAALTAAGCGNRAGEDATHGRISLSGAWALYPLVMRWSEAYRAIHPDVRIDVSAGGAGKGLTDALSGVVDLGMVSRDIHPAEVERGAWWVSVVKDAVVPTISAENPAAEALAAHGLTREQLAAMWMAGPVSDWASVVPGAPAKPVHVYTRSDACGAAETWAKYLGGRQEDLKGTGVYGDPGVAEAVRRDPLGIGFNNVGFAYDVKTGKPVSGLAVVPLDLDGSGSVEPGEAFYGNLETLVEAIRQGRYPSPPARDLHLVSKGVPTRPVVRAFLDWVLTEGQRFVREAGYVGLGEERLAEERRKLDAGK